ncbi:MAG: polysaccharide biosynthesis C-terminal domain-containing protein [Christensenellales bacterium]|jgi:O-antigen/teichoic acid export membrane protein
MSIDTRIHRAKKNIVVSLCCQIVTMVCGIIVPKLMLDSFGSEVYGATASIAQFLSYVVLLEGGIGGVARAVLYKPLADGDDETISAIMAEIRRFFKIVAYIFLAYVLILACSFKAISRVEILDWTSTFLLVIAISISTFGQYFIGVSNAILLQAAQKSYVTNLVNIAGTVVNAAMVVLLISKGCNIIVVKLVSSLVFAIKPVALMLYVRHNYRLHGVPKSGKTYLTQKWSGLGQHIAYFLHTNTDIVILTLFSNLKAVAVYSVYYMIVGNIQNFTASFTAGMEALFGDMLAKKEHARLDATFGMYDTLISFVAVTLFSVTMVMILPFVRIYTASISDANYDVPLFALLMVLSSLLYCLRMPYHSAVIAAGHFRETQLAAYGEAAINVILSMLLVSKFGLVGVAIGTVLATAFRLIYYVLYLSRRILNRSTSLFWKRTSINAAAFLAVCFAGMKVTEFFSIANYKTWVLCSVLTAVIALAICAAANLLFYRQDCARLLKMRKNTF